MDNDCSLVYFVRKSLMPICKLLQIWYSSKNLKIHFNTLAPIDNFNGAISDMSEQFIIGTMRGSFIHKLWSLSESIMKQVLNLQLRVPAVHEKNVIEMSAEADDVNDKIIDFSRPSDYRTKVIEEKHLGVSLSGDDASHLSGTSRMSTVGTATSTESIKTGNTPYEGKC